MNVKRVIAVGAAIPMLLLAGCGTVQPDAADVTEDPAYVEDAGGYADEPGDDVIYLDDYSDAGGTEDGYDTEEGHEALESTDDAEAEDTSAPSGPADSASSSVG